VAAACVLFGVSDAFGLKLQGLGLPNQVTDVAPYIVTLLALGHCRPAPARHRARRDMKSHCRNPNYHSQS